jgi:hypothetical protein
MDSTFLILSLVLHLGARIVVGNVEQNQCMPERSALTTGQPHEHMNASTYKDTTSPEVFSTVETTLSTPDASSIRSSVMIEIGLKQSLLSFMAAQLYQTTSGRLFHAGAIAIITVG